MTTNYTIKLKVTEEKERKRMKEWWDDRKHESPCLYEFIWHKFKNRVQIEYLFGLIVVLSYKDMKYVIDQKSSFD